VLTYLSRDNCYLKLKYFSLPWRDGARPVLSEAEGGRGKIHPHLNPLPSRERDSL